MTNTEIADLLRENKGSTVEDQNLLEGIIKDHLNDCDEDELMRIYTDLEIEYDSDLVPDVEEYLEVYADGNSVLDIFNLGRFSTIDDNTDYHILDGYGNLKPVYNLKEEVLDEYIDEAADKILNSANFEILKDSDIEWLADHNTKEITDEFIDEFLVQF